MQPHYWDDAKNHLSRQCQLMKRLIARYEGETLRARGDGFYTLLRSVVGQQISVKAADAIWAKVQKVVKPLTPKKLLATSEEKLRACGLSGSKVAYARNVAEFYLSRNIATNGAEGSASHIGREATRLNEQREFSRSGEGAMKLNSPSLKSAHPTLSPNSEKASQLAPIVNETSYWDALSDEEAITQLTAIKGIGSWTAEMFLIFHLLRPDVFPVKDLGVLKAINLHLLEGDARLATTKWLKPKEYEAIAQRWAPYRTVATWYLWRALDPVPVAY